MTIEQAVVLLTVGALTNLLLLVYLTRFSMHALLGSRLIAICGGLEAAKKMVARIDAENEHRLALAMWAWAWGQGGRPRQPPTFGGGVSNGRIDL